jgi:hypothetical protein
MKQTMNIYKNEKVSYLPLSILLLFLMLWLPLGQYDFLIDHWMKIGTYAIPFLLIGAFSFFSNSIENKMKLFSFAMLIIYIIHQFEEHWTDLFGEHYAFYTATNKFVLSLLHAKDSRVKRLTVTFIRLLYLTTKCENGTTWACKKTSIPTKAAKTML